jgi:uncharacterized protein YihD (DUF1040 family)
MIYSLVQHTKYSDKREILQLTISELQESFDGYRRELDVLQEDMKILQLGMRAAQSSLEMHQGLLKDFDEQENQHMSTEQTELDSSETVQGKRNPMDMVRLPWKGVKLSEVIHKVLIEQSSTLTTSELTKLIYVTNNDDEFSRARNSLSSELRSGAKAEPSKWQKIGRNAYAAI